MKLSQTLSKVGRPISAPSTPRSGSPNESDSDTSEQEERENIEFYA